MDYSQIYQKVCHRCEEDPIELGKHNGRYKFYYKKQVAVDLIDPLYTLDQVIELANKEIESYGAEAAFDHTPPFDIAQLAKINLMYHSLKERGIIKPFWLQQRGGRYEIVIGGSRRRAMTLLPEITTVPAVLCLDADTEVDSTFKEIASFPDFCNQVDEIPGGTTCWFRVADPETNYGIDWAEFAIDSISGTTGEEFRPNCIATIREYIAKQDDSFRFTHQWFTQHNW